MVLKEVEEVAFAPAESHCSFDPWTSLLVLIRLGSPPAQLSQTPWEQGVEPLAVAEADPTLLSWRFPVVLSQEAVPGLCFPAACLFASCSLHPRCRSSSEPA